VYLLVLVSYLDMLWPLAWKYGYVVTSEWSLVTADQAARAIDRPL